MAGNSLQKQGVPIPDKLTGPRPRTVKGTVVSSRAAPPARNWRSNRRSRVHSPSVRVDTTPAQGVSRARARARVSNKATVPAPTAAAREPRAFTVPRAPKVASGDIGMLEGEFFLTLIILVLVSFTDSSVSYTEKMMSLMKRGSLTCLLFFLLALISTIGPNATTICKAFGGLIVVATLLTSPVTRALGNVDNLIKNDWIGQTPAGATGEGAGSDAGAAAAKAAETL